jgi:hypothetical protein
MKKEEFPTFLNEQPTVVFGRTTRELLIIAIGISSGYLLWQSITGPVAIGAIALSILRITCGLIPVVLALIVAFVKIASRPLEEWMVIGLSYLVLPRVYLYMPLEEESRLDWEGSADEAWLEAVPQSEDDDDRYN